MPETAKRDFSALCSRTESALVRVFPRPIEIYMHSGPLRRITCVFRGVARSLVGEALDIVVRLRHLNNGADGRERGNAG